MNFGVSALWAELSWYQMVGQALVTCLLHMRRVPVVSAAVGIPTSLTSTTGAGLSAHDAWTVRATGPLPGGSGGSLTNWRTAAANAEIGIWPPEFRLWPRWTVAHHGETLFSYLKCREFLWRRENAGSTLGASLRSHSGACPSGLILSGQGPVTFFPARLTVPSARLTWSCPTVRQSGGSNGNSKRHAGMVAASLRCDSDPE
jgi:hypothetical protein